MVILVQIRSSGWVGGESSFGVVLHTMYRLMVPLGVVRVTLMRVPEGWVDRICIMAVALCLCAHVCAVAPACACWHGELPSGEVSASGVALSGTVWAEDPMEPQSALAEVQG